MSKFAFDHTAERYPEVFEHRYRDRVGDEWAVVRPAALQTVASHLKNDPHLEFRLFLSLDAVDRLLLPDNKPRYEVVYFLYSLKRNENVRMKCRTDDPDPQLPSITAIFQGANWFERFVWDFYGIRFVGHPDLRRILMYEEFQGYPLRKDYPLRGRQPLVPERPIQDIFRGPGTNSML